MSRVMCRGTRTRGVGEVFDDESARGEVVDDEPERGRVVDDERCDEPRDEPRDVPRHLDARLSGILPGYSCKEGRIVEDGLLIEFLCTPTRTRSV
jgi:hypothetical protein